MKHSVIITNKMREEIALKLTIKAVSKQAPKLAAKAKKLNDWFWEQHSKKVEKLSKINRKDWPPLIAEGMINGTVLVRPAVEVSREGSISLEGMLLIREVSSEARGVLKSSEFQCLAAHIRVHGYYDDRYSLQFTSPTTVPALNRMEVISHVQTIEAAKGLESDLKLVFESIDKFHDEVMSILCSCKTSKQLEEILPEAAALIPARPEHMKALLPVEQAKAIREMLKTGVPPMVQGS